MKNSELKKLLKNSMVRYNTIPKARNKVLENIKGLDRDELKLKVRCFTSFETDDEMSTDLQVEIYYEDEYMDTVVVSSIELNSEITNLNEIDFWEFKETSEKIFTTMKKNMVKELNTYCLNIASTEDYNL